MIPAEYYYILLMNCIWITIVLQQHIDIIKVNTAIYLLLSYSLLTAS